uniref:Protein fantom n=1 Tax=Esox lucius TaxID=8010 RepID=A0AAY5L3E8_ESOLU
MSLMADETAADLPVRDVGMTRGGMMPTVTDRQRIFQVPREQLEDQCSRLREENTLLRQHTRAQEQRLRRLNATTGKYHT